MNIQEQFGQIDIYLFDQILRGNIGKGYAAYSTQGADMAETWCTCFAKAAKCLQWTLMPREWSTFASSLHRLEPGCRPSILEWARLKKCRFRMSLPMW